MYFRSQHVGIKRKLDLKNADESTVAFRRRLSLVQLPEVQNWTVDLAKSEEVQQKIPVSESFFMAVQAGEYRDVAKYLKASDRPAVLIEERLRDAMEKRAERPIQSEMDVHSEAENLSPSSRPFAQEVLIATRVAVRRAVGQTLRCQ